MGTSASANRAKRIDKKIQIPASHMTPLVSLPSTTVVVPSEKSRKEQQQPNVEWPLPPQENHKAFHLVRLMKDNNRYVLKWNYDELSPRFNSSDAESVIKSQQHQKEMSSSQWNKDNSSINHSAHVQSTLKTQSHSCINLSTSDEITTLLTKLNLAHTTLDDEVRRRLALVSQETQTIIKFIAQDTQFEQQRMLSDARQVQMRQEELYREYLQLYVAQLDEWKSEELTRLQEELLTAQKHISAASQQRISDVNKQANDIKAQILRQEQNKVSAYITTLIAQIESLSNQETLQCLGSETMTNINLTVHANVGRKAAGQGCKFTFENNTFKQSAQIEEHQTGTENQPKTNIPLKRGKMTTDDNTKH